MQLVKCPSPNPESNGPRSLALIAGTGWYWIWLENPENAAYVTVLAISGAPLPGDWLNGLVGRF